MKKEELSKQQLHFNLMTSNPPRNGNNKAEKCGCNMVETTNNRRIPLDGKRLQMTPFRHDNDVELRAGFTNWGRGSAGGSGELKLKNGKAKPNYIFTILGKKQTGICEPMLDLGGVKYQCQNFFCSNSILQHLTEKDDAISPMKTFAQPDTPSREVPYRLLPIKFKNYNASLKISKSIIEEYTSIKDVKKAMLCIEEKFHPRQVAWFVQATMEYATDRDSEKRSLVGRLFHDLMINKKLTLTQFLKGSNSVIEMIEDLRLDIPQVCENLGEILAPLLLDGAINVKDLLKIVEPAATKKIDVWGVPTPTAGDNLDVQIFANTLYSASTLLGPSRVQNMWLESKLTWEKLLYRANVQEFLEKHRVRFTVGRIVTHEEKIISTDNDSSQIEESSLPIPFDGPKIRKQLISLFKRDVSTKEIFDWIEDNVGSHTSCPPFARALTQAIVESQMETSADGSHLAIGEDFQKNLKNKAKLITKYVDNCENCELACLFGIQQVSVENQHPAGLMEQSFNALYDEDVITNDSFLEWAKNEDPEEQLGKGICLTSVSKFLSWLPESEAEDTRETDKTSDPSSYQNMWLERTLSWEKFLDKDNVGVFLEKHGVKSTLNKTLEKEIVVERQLVAEEEAATDAHISGGAENKAETFVRHPSGPEEVATTVVLTCEVAEINADVDVRQQLNAEKETECTCEITEFKVELSADMEAASDVTEFKTKFNFEQQLCGDKKAFTVVHTCEVAESKAHVDVSPQLSSEEEAATNGRACEVAEFQVEMGIERQLSADEEPATDVEICEKAEFKTGIDVGRQLCAEENSVTDVLNCDDTEIKAETVVEQQLCSDEETATNVHTCEITEIIANVDVRQQLRADKEAATNYRTCEVTEFKVEIGVGRQQGADEGASTDINTYEDAEMKVLIDVGQLSADGEAAPDVEICEKAEFKIEIDVSRPPGEEENAVIDVQTMAETEIKAEILVGQQLCSDKVAATDVRTCDDADFSPEIVGQQPGANEVAATDVNICEVIVLFNLIMKLLWLEAASKGFWERKQN